MNLMDETPTEERAPSSMPHLARVELQIEGPPPRIPLPAERYPGARDAAGNRSPVNATRRVALGPPEPYPQVLEDNEPDMLVISYPQVDDDSKPALADHQFVSSQGAILRAPAPYLSAVE